MSYGGGRRARKEGIGGRAIGSGQQKAPRGNLGVKGGLAYFSAAVAGEGAKGHQRDE